eukprot:9255183-Lingulodinium_polyedra.AAC.1
MAAGCQVAGADPGGRPMHIGRDQDTPHARALHRRAGGHGFRGCRTPLRIQGAYGGVRPARGTSMDTPSSTPS